MGGSSTCARTSYVFCIYLKCFTNIVMNVRLSEMTLNFLTLFLALFLMCFFYHKGINFGKEQKTVVIYNK